MAKKDLGAALDAAGVTVNTPKTEEAPKVPETPKVTSKTYSEDEVKALLKQQLGEQQENMKSLISEEVKKAIQQVPKDSNSVDAVRQILEQQLPYPKKSESVPYISEMEKLFEEKGVGKKMLTFKTIPGKFRTLQIPARQTTFKDGKVIEMLATASHESPFRFHQPEDLKLWNPKIRSIQFIGVKDADYGICNIGPNQPGLQAYLLCYDKFGRWYTLEDKVQDAKNYRKERKLRKKLEANLEEMFENDEEAFRTISVGVVGETSAVQLTMDELYEKATTLLDRDMNLYKQSIEDPRNECRYMYQMAFVKNIFNESGGRVTYHGREIYNIKMAESPSEAFYKLCLKDRNLFNAVKSDL